MKLKEAIIYLSADSCRDCVCNDDGVCLGDLKCFESKRLAIEALYKQIPAAVIDSRKYDDEGLYIGYCPVCKDGANSEMNFCMKCGQKLDWRVI